MVYKERQTQNMGRVARAFNVFTHAAQKDETSLPNSTQITRGLSREEEFNVEYQRYKAQLVVNRPVVK